jgi:excisionase family DNA binding protein
MWYGAGMATKEQRLQTLLTVDQVAHRIGQSKWTIYRKVAAGEIPAVRLGPGRSALRVRADELETRLDEMRVMPCR